MKRKSLLGYYDYTVVLTYCGLLFAVAGIIRAIEADYWTAVVCMMFSGLCDMFDGMVANTKDRNESEKKFGIQIDSLSDLVSFGVLPGVFVYMISGRTVFAGAISSFFVLCALIRLAFFNVLEEERQEQTSERRKSYLGLPVTNIALLLPALYLLFTCTTFQKTIWFNILLLAVAVCFVLPFEVKKPKRMGMCVIILIGLIEIAGMVITYMLGMR